ncbi:MAG TPA: hypothetical protein VLE23_09865 [Geminicoccaceae bacterium]|nr:hypothetical protein [Geminicoccaceae bacterium]
MPNLISKRSGQRPDPRHARVEAHARSGGGETAIVVALTLHIADVRA